LSFLFIYGRPPLFGEAVTPKAQKGEILSPPFRDFTQHVFLTSGLKKNFTDLTKTCSYALNIFLRLAPARPIRPAPRSSIVAGSGTGAGAVEPKEKVI
jgi:hypothetical protein